MHRGIDAAQLDSQQYDYALNIRLVFNTDGTWAAEPTKGAKFVFTIAADYGQKTDYQPIGSCYVNGSLLIISTNNKENGSPFNSEIGQVRQNQFGAYTYKTLFNDLYDPYGDKLNLSLQFNVRMTAVQENNVIERIYWNDDRNEPRVFNILAGATPYTLSTPPFTTYFATPYAPPYPSWYSVHGMAQMPDLTWGLIKYTQNIQGGLKSGERQYAYRYIHQTGYASPWSYLSEFVFLTKNEVNAGDWTKYQMGASGVATNKGHQLEITELDTRFQKIEVACLYWETNTGANSASIIFSGDITGTSIQVNHVSDVGTIISPDELIQKFLNIKNAKTQNIHYDNYYHLGNLELYGDLKVETKDYTVEPVLRRMISDETDGRTSLPLTNQTPKNSSIDKTIFAGGTSDYIENYPIVNDYINYKGTQWTNLHKGYFRRETYPFGIVVWNRKGQPLFAWHITDYTFPEQYNNNFTDTRLNSVVTGTVGAVGDYVLTNYSPGSVYQITNDATNPILQGENIVLNMMGIKFGNIDLTDILFDANGKLQVSGFSIVRMDRFASIVGQGLLLNTVRNSNKTLTPINCTYTNETRPLPSAWNYLFDVSAGVTPTDSRIGQMQDDCPINPRGHWHTFECPDYFIDQTIFQGGSITDKINLVGGYFPSFRNPAFKDSLTRLATPPYPDDTYHYYNKNYQTDPTDANWFRVWDALTEQAGAGWGAQWTVDKLYADARNINGIDGSNLNYREYSGIQNYQDMVTNDPDDDFSAISHLHTVLVSLSLNTCSTRYADFHCAYYLANYLKPVAFQQVTDVSLENRVYYNIGHFVPINANTIAKALDAATGKYVFNNVEVWGGDCYTEYFGYARLVPNYYDVEADDIKDCAYYDTHHEPDYAIGLMFPVESKFNIAMRGGDDYPKVGTRPHSTYCGDTTTFNEGIFYQDDSVLKWEDFDVNKVLQAHDLISNFNAKRTLLNPDITDFPLMEAHSLQKFYGENFDSYRKFLTHNFQFANGAYGEIISIEQLFGNLYVLQEAALARIRFKERVLVQTTTGTINTGTGAGYESHDYISTEYGCQHQFGIVNSTKSIYFPDANRGKWLRFGQDGVNNLSDSYDARWMQTKLREYWYVKDEVNSIEAKYYDNPSYAGGIVGVMDYKNQSVVLTFTRRKISRNVAAGPPIIEEGTAETIEYNEMTNSFQTYHSFTPRWYLSMKQNYLSLNPDIIDGKCYSHDEEKRGVIYGVNKQSKLRFIANPDKTVAKTFDNSALIIAGDGVGGTNSLVSLWTGETNIIAQQSVVLNNAAVDNRPVYREGRIVFPTMSKNQSVRLRGDYCINELTISNDGSDRNVRLTGVETKYRISERH